MGKFKDFVESPNIGEFRKPFPHEILPDEIYRLVDSGKISFPTSYGGPLKCDPEDPKSYMPAEEYQAVIDDQIKASSQSIGRRAIRSTIERVKVAFRDQPF